jgi:hypothetical protein
LIAVFHDLTEMFRILKKSLDCAMSRQSDGGSDFASVLLFDLELRHSPTCVTYHIDDQAERAISYFMFQRLDFHPNNTLAVLKSAKQSSPSAYSSYSYIHQSHHSSDKMPELPLEIWAVIAKHVKRDPPPAGECGNWNNHFHQQDLVNLMRVNQVSRVRLQARHDPHVYGTDRGHC